MFRKNYVFTIDKLYLRGPTLARGTLFGDL